DDCAVLDRETLMQRRAQPVQNRALRLIEGAGGIDDLPADVHGSPDLVNARYAALIDARLDHLGHVTKVAVPQRQAHAATRAHLPLAPPGLLGHQLQPPARPTGVKRWYAQPRHA